MSARPVPGPRPRLEGKDDLDEPLTDEERSALGSVVLCHRENRLERRTVKALAMVAVAAIRKMRKEA